MTVNEILSQAKNEKRTVLTEIEAKQILAEAGINCTDTRLAKGKDDAVSLSEEIGFPVVLKISSVDITHKSDAGGVKVNLKDKASVENAFDEIMASAREKFPEADIEGISVQSMAKPGIEIIMGMTKDAQFGPVLMFGLGGVFVEVLKDVAFRIVPLEKRDAAEMIRDYLGRFGLFATLSMLDTAHVVINSHIHWPRLPSFEIEWLELRFPGIIWEALCEEPL